MHRTSVSRLVAARVAMNGYEKVCIIVARNHRPVVQTYELICGPCIYDLYIRICFLDLLSKQFRYAKDDMFLMRRRALSQCARVLSSMARIDHYCIEAKGLGLSTDVNTRAHKHKERNYKLYIEFKGHQRYTILY